MCFTVQVFTESLVCVPATLCWTACAAMNEGKGPRKAVVTHLVEKE